MGSVPAVHSGATSSLRQREAQQTESAFASCKTSLPPLVCRSSPASRCRFLRSSWTSPTRGLNGETTTFTSSTFSSWLPQSDKARQRIPGGYSNLGALTYFPNCWRQSQDSSPGASPTTHRRCTQRGQLGKLHVQIFASGKSSSTRLQTSTPAAWIEIFERRLSLWEEQQLQHPYHPRHSACASQSDSLTVSLRVVHIHRLLGMSGSGCGTLEAPQWPIAPSTVTRNSTSPRNFVHSESRQKKKKGSNRMALHT